MMKDKEAHVLALSLSNSATKGKRKRKFESSREQ